MAERIGTTRQAISKWENNQGFPETEKLLQFSDIVQHILAFLEDGVSETREKQQRYLPLFAAYVTRLCGLQVLKNYVDYV